MQVAFYKTDVSDLHKSCECGGQMRLVGIEPAVNTNADICTYECNACRKIEVVPPRELPR